MFILCPHCQFLVAIDPASGLPPACCPRCGQSLRPEEPAPIAAEPVAVSAMSEQLPSSAPAPVQSLSPTPSASAETETEGEGEAQTEAKTEAEAEAQIIAASSGDALERSVDPDALGEMLVQAQTETESPASVDEAAVPVVPDVAPPAPPASAAAEVEAHAAALDGAVVRTSQAAAPRRRASAPSFAHGATTTDAPVARRWRTLAVLAGLSLLLVLQVLIADRARLAMDARWRPALGALCDVLHCALPAWHQPEAFTLVARDVRPARQGVLHVTATFRNDARWPQAWPALHLALQDVDGGTIGARVFTPSEYLGGLHTQNGLAPGQVASIAFDVVEPPGTVVAFTFDFR